MIVCDQCGAEIKDARDCIHANGLNFCCEPCLLWYENMIHADSQNDDDETNSSMKDSIYDSDAWNDPYRRISVLVHYICRIHQPWECFAIAHSLLSEVAENGKGMDEVDLVELNDDFMALLKKHFKAQQENK